MAGLVVCDGARYVLRHRSENSASSGINSPSPWEQRNPSPSWGRIPSSVRNRRAPPGCGRGHPPARTKSHCRLKNSGKDFLQARGQRSIKRCSGLTEPEGRRGGISGETTPKRLRLSTAPPKKIGALIKRFGKSFPRGSKAWASETLRDLGNRARPQLENALKNEELSSPARARIKLLLAAPGSVTNPDLLALRVVHVLEWIAMPKAQNLLKDYAKNPNDPIGLEAQAALRRLSSSKR